MGGAYKSVRSDVSGDANSESCNTHAPEVVEVTFLVVLRLWLASGRSDSLGCANSVMCTLAKADVGQDACLVKLTLCFA